MIVKAQLDRTGTVVLLYNENRLFLRQFHVDDTLAIARGIITAYHLTPGDKRYIDVTLPMKQSGPLVLNVNEPVDQDQDW